MGGNLTAMAQKTHQPPPDDDSQTKLIDAQVDSPFFARLPVEIRRMIYLEVWRTYGRDDDDDDDDDNDNDDERLADTPDYKAWWRRTHGGGSLAVHIRADGCGQHGQTTTYTTTPCFLGIDDDDDTNTDTARPPPEATRDIRAERLAATRASSTTALVLRSEVAPPPLPPVTTPRRRQQRPPVSHRVWQQRMAHPWLAHWPCDDVQRNAEDDDDNDDHRYNPPRPFLPILLACRRAHAEAKDLLYTALTFQFTDLRDALGFLRRWPQVASVRLCLALPPELVYAYAGPAVVRDPPPSLADPAARDPYYTIDYAQFWPQLLETLAGRENSHLRRLRIWAELATSSSPAPPPTSPWRAWHRVAVETRLFAPLLETVPPRLARPGGIVLYLPALPKHAADRGLPGWCYLGEDDDDDDDTPDDDKPHLDKPLHVPIVVRTPRHESP